MENVLGLEMNMKGRGAPPCTFTPQKSRHRHVFKYYFDILGNMFFAGRQTKWSIHIYNIYILWEWWWIWERLACYWLENLHHCITQDSCNKQNVIQHLWNSFIYASYVSFYQYNVWTETWLVHLGVICCNNFLENSQIDQQTSRFY